MTRASRHERSHPLPEQHVTLTVDFHCAPDRMERIRQGFTPSVMEERWHMYVEDDTLYIHRSWTGYCIYVADFVETDDGYRVERLRVSRDAQQYGTPSDEYDINMFTNLVNWLAGR